MTWRWACASVKGTSHIQSGEPREDAYSVSQIGDETIFAIVSDGAGSAKFGRQGARLTCRFLKACFRDRLRGQREIPSDEELRRWVDDLRDRIADKAHKRMSAFQQYAATLAAILISPSNLVTMQIGDSAIVGRRGAEWNVLCWPENGEYASSTYFITDSPELRLNIKRHSLEYDAFALFTDGVGDLALSQLEQVAHAQLFSQIMRRINALLNYWNFAARSANIKIYILLIHKFVRTQVVI